MRLVGAEATGGSREQQQKLYIYIHILYRVHANLSVTLNICGKPILVKPPERDKESVRLYNISIIAVKL